LESKKKQRPYDRSTSALVLGAGFSKLWGLPLAAEIMDFKAFERRLFPGAWQRKLITRVRHLWEDSASQHKGVVDEFARSLHRSDELRDLVSFLALRLSSEHWRVGGARETKWGTGDHIRKQRQIPRQYSYLIRALENINLAGIVTTNYDIVVEKLLGPGTHGRLGGFNYGAAEETLVGRHAVSSKWCYGPVAVRGKVPLLKLHGSLNWALSPQGEIIKYVDCRPSRGRRYRPLVLPPGATSEGDALREMWDSARDVLTQSETWIFCGYSLPHYDEPVQELLAKSAEGRIARVLVLDTDPATGDKVSRVLRNTRRTIPVKQLPGLTKELGERELREIAAGIGNA
jgi:hypothetical protein